MNKIRDMRDDAEIREYLKPFPAMPSSFKTAFQALSDAEKEKARDFPHMHPDAFAKKWNNIPVVSAISPEELATVLSTEEMLPVEDSPEETGFVPDVSEEPANAWEETALPDPEVLQPDDDLPF
jgi:hypothetical protein